MCVMRMYLTVRECRRGRVIDVGENIYLDGDGNIWVWGGARF
jgi:hypothetical protein